MSRIKNIIFDVGDVLLEYRWKDVLMEAGLSEQEALLCGHSMFDSKIWSQLDSGDVTLQEARDQYVKLFPEYTEAISRFLNYPVLMRVNRPKVWEGVHALKTAGYKIYILSNYSRELFESHTEGADFWADVDGKVVSYEIHVAKPDERIYLHLLTKYELKAEECFFFDDRADNTAAAEKLGIRTITVTSQEQLLTAMKESFPEAFSC